MEHIEAAPLVVRYAALALEPNDTPHSPVGWESVSDGVRIYYDNADRWHWTAADLAGVAATCPEPEMVAECREWSAVLPPPAADAIATVERYWTWREAER